MFCDDEDERTICEDNSARGTAKMCACEAVAKMGRGRSACGAALVLAWLPSRESEAEACARGGTSTAGPWNSRSDRSSLGCVLPAERLCGFVSVDLFDGVVVQIAPE